MTEEMKRELEQAGIRTEQALERFMGNEMLLERFLKKFLDDPNYGKLMKAMEEGDPKSAFKAAHTLKGVAGNLSMEPLMDAAGRITEALRKDRWEEAEALKPRIRAVYEETAGALKRIF